MHNEGPYHTAKRQCSVVHEFGGAPKIGHCRIRISTDFWPISLTLPKGDGAGIRLTYP
jgi:hypothetical protein